MTIAQAYGEWVLGETKQLVNAADDVDDAGPWTLTFSPVNVKVIGNPPPAPLSAQELAAGYQPWQRALDQLCRETIQLSYGAQGTEVLTLDYPITGGVLSVFASSVNVIGIKVQTALLPSAYYTPVGAVTLTRGERVAPRRRWTQTRTPVFDPATGIALAAAPMRAAGYRLAFYGTTDGQQLPSALTVEQTNIGSGAAWTDAYQRFSFYGGAGVGSQLHRDSFVPLVDGATGLRFTTSIPTPPDPVPLHFSVQWLLDL